MNVLRMGIVILMLTLVERSIIVILMLLANLALVRIISFDMSDMVPRQFVNRSLKISIFKEMFMCTNFIPRRFKCCNKSVLKINHESIFFSLHINQNIFFSPY